MFSFEFRKLLIPLARYSGGQYDIAAKLIIRRRVAGDYSIVAALLYAVCNHHIGESGVAMAYYKDIHEKADEKIFFNSDSTEYIKSFIEKHGFGESTNRNFEFRKVNYFLRRFFLI